MSDFYIRKGDILPKIRQRISFPVAVDLEGATVQFRYESTSGGSATTRSATIVDDSFSPAEDSATEVTLEYTWQTADTATAGTFNFEWIITLSGGRTLVVPTISPTSNMQTRVNPVFEVVAILT